MEKCKRTEAVNGEIPLPEPIIQHIQSFLSGKQAARTSILSKSWYSAWSTRPSLDFDERDFGSNSRKGGDEKVFCKFLKKTMQRYEESNLKIESFRLLMRGIWSDNARHYIYSLADELIVKAMKMGATDLDLELLYRSRAFALPHEVLRSKNLVRLSVAGCRIDGNVSCSRLKSLSLCNVYIQCDIIQDVISRCPLIEKFSLSESSWLHKDLQQTDVVRTLSRSLGSVVGGPINLYELHKLKCLLLGNVDVDTSFFRDLSSRFPCLKDLSLHYCGGYDYKGIQLSSRSLECISFAQTRMLRAMFDVPRIRRFSFSGSRLPALSFGTASTGWESYISIRCDRPSTSWFLKLKKMLTSLSLSKVSLTLEIQFIVEKSVDFQGLPEAVAVENLTMHSPCSICSTLLECVFKSCRPKFITQYWLPNSCRGGSAKNNRFLKILCQRLVEERYENCSTPNQNMFYLHDLEDVNVEILEENLVEWRPLPWKTLLDASASPENKRKIRFGLRWAQEPSTFR